MRRSDEAHHAVMSTAEQSDESLRSCGAVKVRSLERQHPSPLSWRCPNGLTDSRICRVTMGDTTHFRPLKHSGFT